MKISPVFSSIASDDRPYLNIFIHTVKLTCLLDTGSNLNILGANGLYLIEKFKLKLFSNSDSLKVTTADGTPQRNIGVVYLPVVFNNTEIPLKCLVIPTVKHALILGIDFCKAVNLQLSFENLSWQATAGCTKGINSLHSSEELSPLQQSRLKKKSICF